MSSSHMSVLFKRSIPSWCLTMCFWYDMWSDILRFKITIGLYQSGSRKEYYVPCANKTCRENSSYILTYHDGTQYDAWKTTRMGQASIKTYWWLPKLDPGIHSEKSCPGSIWDRWFTYVILLVRWPVCPRRTFDDGSTGTTDPLLTFCDWPIGIINLLTFD